MLTLDESNAWIKPTDYKSVISNGIKEIFNRLSNHPKNKLNNLTIIQALRTQYWLMFDHRRYYYMMQDVLRGKILRAAHETARRLTPL